MGRGESLAFPSVWFLSWVLLRLLKNPVDQLEQICAVNALRANSFTAGFVMLSSHSFSFLAITLLMVFTFILYLSFN